MNRRQFLSGLGLLSLSSLSMAGLKYWPQPSVMNACIPSLPTTLADYPEMQSLWQGINPELVWDTHTHLVGTGDSGSGAWFNPNMDSWMHPVLKTQKHFYMNGLCADPMHVDTSAVTRMVTLLNAMPVGFKSMLFAFDYRHDAAGRRLPDTSIFYVPNAYAASVAQAYPTRFEWVASIHPYRADAIDALEQAAAKGARAIKWLPSGMGIDPASPKCDQFYATAAKLKLPIITHTGRESAVQGGNQDDGNPLKLRRALDHGVTVILAHCASDGEDIDLDQSSHGPRVKSFALFQRLMEEKQYQAQLYGELSAITLINHAWAIPNILEHTDWHNRLINGSDYPLPAIMPLVSLPQLVSKGLLDEAHVAFLTQLKSSNAFLFDFALKRLMQWQGISLPASVFETKRVFVPA